MKTVHQDLVSFRRDLHACAELSGQEHATAQKLRTRLDAFAPDALYTELGGHGLAATFTGPQPGPTLLVRSDMDALPIDETIDIPHASRTSGVAHKCGHDGHMTMLTGLGAELARHSPERGRVVLLFQPAEETGEGAARVIADPQFDALQPDRCLALHNLPGVPLGTAVLAPGPFASASRGLVTELRGATSHAAEPERGRSPALAVAQIIQAWSAARQVYTAYGDTVQATVIHAAVGRRAFGTSPGEGRVLATLRAPEDDLLDDFEQRLRKLAAHTAAAYELEVSFEVTESFPACTNDPALVTEIAAIAKRASLPTLEFAGPYAWSEDFGHFSKLCPSVLVGLGAGEGQPVLHHPHYDFPDDLLPHGVRLLTSIVRAWHG